MGNFLIKPWWRGGGGISHLQSHPRSAQRVADGGMMYRDGQDL